MSELGEELGEEGMIWCSRVEVPDVNEPLSRAAENREENPIVGGPRDQLTGELEAPLRRTPKRSERDSQEARRFEIPAPSLEQGRHARPHGSVVACLGGLDATINNLAQFMRRACRTYRKNMKTD